MLLASIGRIGSSPQEEAVWLIPPPSPQPSLPPWSQDHVLSHPLRAQLPSRHLTEVRRSSRVRVLGCRIQEELFPPPSSCPSGSGEEVINKGSCLLSTWNIPGIMTKTQCAISYLILKTQPQEDCWLCYRGRNKLRGVKSLAQITQHRADSTSGLTPLPWAYPPHPY